MLIEKFKNFRIENVFLFISLIFGILYAFILPPFQSVDEPAHFYRGYEIVSNRFVSQKINNQTGDYLPASLEKLSLKYSFFIKNIDAKINYQYIDKTAKLKLEPTKTKFIDFKNTALYSPVTYLTQIPGMYIAKGLNLNPLAIFYFGRVSNLLFYILLVYFSIKTIPIFKLPMILLAAAPMTLSIASSLTSDVVVFGFNFLWISFLVKFIYKQTKINFMDIMILLAIAIILALSKNYWLLIPLIFLLPKSKFRNTKNYAISLLSIIIISLACMAYWQMIVHGIYSNLNSSAEYIQQLQFIQTHPIEYFMTFIKSLIIKMPRIIITMIGVLGWQDTPLDFITYILYPLMIILSLFTETKKDFSFKKWQLGVIATDIFAAVFVIFTTMYIMWSPVGASIITGLNGKYFTPLMLPFLLIFYNSTKNIIKNDTRENIKLFIYIFLILILISSELSLLHRFYGLTPNLYYKI